MDLSTLTKKQLVELASEKDIRFKKSGKKSEIIAAIEKGEKNSDPIWKICKETGLRFDAKEFGYSDRVQIHPTINWYKAEANDDRWGGRYQDAIEYGVAQKWDTLEQFEQELVNARKGIARHAEPENQIEATEGRPDICHTLGRANSVDPTGVTVTTEAHNGWSSGYLRSYQKGENIGKAKFSYCEGDRSSLSRAGNGYIGYYDLNDGYYEGVSVVRSYQSEQYFIKIEGENFWIFDSYNEFVADMWDISTEELEAERIKQKQQKENELGELPELEGSEKQIKWARDIRIKKLKRFEQDYLTQLKYLESCEPGEDLEERHIQEAISDLKFHYNLIRSISKSRFWIDCRDYTNLITRTVFDEAQTYMTREQKDSYYTKIYLVTDKSYYSDLKNNDFDSQEEAIRISDYQNLSFEPGDLQYCESQLATIHQVFNRGLREVLNRGEKYHFYRRIVVAEGEFYVEIKQRKQKSFQILEAPSNYQHMIGYYSSIDGFKTWCDRMGWDYKNSQDKF